MKISLDQVLPPNFPQTEVKFFVSRSRELDFTSFWDLKLGKLLVSNLRGKTIIQKLPTVTSENLGVGHCF